MLRSYLIVLLRNFWKNKTASIVNLTGLAVGLTACLLIATFVLDELSADKHWPKHQRLYRLIRVNFNGTAEEHSSDLISNYATDLKKQFPQVEAVTRGWFETREFKFQDKAVKAAQWTVEADAFGMFDFEFLQGGVATTDFTNDALVITQSYARKLFRDVNPVGKIIVSVSVYQEPKPYRIAGVIKDIPTNSHLHTDVLLLAKHPPSYDEPKDFGFVLPQYVLLNKRTNTKKLATLASNYFLKSRQWDKRSRLELQPIADVYLYSHNTEDTAERRGNIQYIYLFTAIGVFLLLLACINFINLTTAGALQRSRETGLRKVLGAQRPQLIGQFLFESLCFFTVGGLLALLAYQLALPALNRFIGRPLTVNPFENLQLLFVVGIVLLTVGVLTGIYPALLLSSYQPASVMKGFFRVAGDRFRLRRSLVAIQFVVSILLIAATIVVYQQLRYVNQKNLGFYKDNIIRVESWLGSKTATVKQEILRNPDVVSVTISGWAPGDKYAGGMHMEFPDPLQSGRTAKAFGVNADFDFLQTLGIPLKEGRNFDPRYAADRIDVDSLMRAGKDVSENSIILNETGVRKLGLTNPIGQRLRFEALQGTVIGIMKDYHSVSLHEEVPIVFLRAKPVNAYGSMLIRVRSGKLAETTAYIQKVWQKFFPDRPFSYSYVDDRLEQLYKNEERLGQLFGCFSLLAIFISCLGLVGLVAFAVERRTKEIGIRKILGASVGHILLLLSKEFVWLVCFAFVIAVPIAWYAVHQWLQIFAYRIDIEWWIFALAGLLALLIALITVSFQALKAALANPVKSLRSE
jgi:putative ABC transport system permease protein